MTGPYTLGSCHARENRGFGVPEPGFFPCQPRHWTDHGNRLLLKFRRLTYFAHNTAFT